jgi:pimeloyl-ACP methyl ester carboxylesterase
MIMAGTPNRKDRSGVRNIVIVHGAFADGSGWRGVYETLTQRGYGVSIVQNPLTSLQDDVAATRRVLARQDGPAILVGHSYGGTVITEAGMDPKVAGLVYVAALAPDAGESTGDQFADIPAPPTFIIETQEDGFGFVNLEKFKLGFAGDLSDADAAFLRDSQVPIAMSIFETPVSSARMANQAQLGRHTERRWRYRPEAAAAHGEAHRRLQSRGRCQPRRLPVSTRGGGQCDRSCGSTFDAHRALIQATSAALQPGHRPFPAHLGNGGFRDEPA